MIKVLYTNAQDYWAASVGAYPHRVVCNIGEPYPRDAERDLKLEGSYIVCHINGLAHWGFKHKADLKLFKDFYEI